MGKVRSAAVAALAGSLIFAAGAPAFAAGDPLGVLSTGLTDGQVVGARQVIHPIVSGAVTSLDLLVDGVLQHTWTTAPAALTLPFPLAKPLTEADITVRVHDAANETAEATTHVSIDVTPPVATFTPASGAIVHGSSVTVTATGLSDDVAQVAVVDPTGQVLAGTTSAPWSITWNLTGGAGGSQHLLMMVTDKAGNRSTYHLVYPIDNAGPVSTVDWRGADVQGVVPNGLNYVNAQVSDLSGVDRDEWWIGGVQVGTGTSLMYDFGNTSRTVTGEIRAWDKLGNASVWPFTIDVDASAPVITSITPASGALVRGTTITSTLQATDRSGFQYATLSGATTDFTAPFTGTIPAGKDGSHVLTWSVNDTFYHLATAQRTVIVDNTKPAVKVTSAPKTGAKVSGTVKVAASASDHNGVARAELLINGKVIATDTTSGYSFSVNSAKYGTSLKVQVRAYDRAGNSTTSSTLTWHR